MGYKAASVIPAPRRVSPDRSGQSDSGNSSGGGAVSGTDSESEVDTAGKTVIDL